MRTTIHDRPETYLERIQRECRAAMAELRRVDYLPLSRILGRREPRPSRPGDRAAWKAPWPGPRPSC